MGTIKSIVDVKEDPDGRIITMGGFLGTMDLDLGPGEAMISAPSAQGVFITAMQADGAMDWAIGIAGNNPVNGRQILVDTDGSIVVIGVFKGTADFDPSAEVFELSAGFDWDVFVAKYAPDGTFIWAWMLGNSNDEFAGRMALGANGTILLAQNLRGNVDVDPGTSTTTYAGGSNGEVALLSYASDGTFQSVSRIGAVGTVQLTPLPSGDLMLAGTFGGSVELGTAPNTLTLTGHPSFGDVYILRMSAAGVPMSASVFGGAGSEQDIRAEFAADGSVAVVGAYSGTIDLDPGPDSTQYTPVGSLDNFVVKLDADGSFVWGGSWGTTFGDDVEWMATDGYGDIYIVAPLYGEIDVDPGPGSTLLTNTVGTFNSYLLKLDGSDGSVSFAFPLLNSATGYLQCRHVFITHVGSIITSGVFRSTCDMDPGPNEDLLTPQVELSEEVYLCKFDQDIGLSVPSASMGELLLFPQPCSDELHVVHQGTTGTYVILDLEGRVLQTGQLQPLQDVIPVAELASGAYLLTVEEPSGRWSKRFVKVR